MSDEHERHLIVVDVETTGLIVGVHVPLEIAAVNVSTGEEFYFVPSLPFGALENASPDVMQINRYFERGVYMQKLGKKASHNRWYELWDLLAGNTLGGSNPAFDAAMLNSGCAESENYDGASPWHHRLADLSAYAAGALGFGPSELPGLNVVCQALKVENDAPHTAMGDARATAACFRELIEMHCENGLSA